jgi:4-hydroxy-3-polyprenylbenzoate decarboxylase
MTQSGSAGPHDLVLAMTGASGAPYALRLLQLLCRLGRTVHLSISPSGAQVLAAELGLEVTLDRFDPNILGDLGTGRLIYHYYQDFAAPIASGSFLTDGMILIPCSMSTLGSIASGASTNLITRAADVHLKEHRKLILVPRETPLSLIHLENMLRVTRAGALVMPAMPGWYHRPRHLPDLIDFVVARIVDQLGIACNLIQRWGNEPQDHPLEDPDFGALIDLDQTDPEPLDGA